MIKQYQKYVKLNHVNLLVTRPIGQFSMETHWTIQYGDVHVQRVDSGNRKGRFWRTWAAFVTCTGERVDSGNRRGGNQHPLSIWSHIQYKFSVCKCFWCLYGTSWVCQAIGGPAWRVPAGTWWHIFCHDYCRKPALLRSGCSGFEAWAK